jgi:hypothetical protein
MEIKLQVSILKPLVKKEENLFAKAIDYWKLRDLQKEKGYQFQDTDMVTIELPKFNTTELKKLWSVLGAAEAPERTLDTIHRWMEVLKNPDNATVTSLQAMEKIFRPLILKSQNKWLFTEKEDGQLCPVLVKDFAYHSPRKDYSAYFDIDITYGYYFGEELDDDEKAGQIKDESINFYSHHLVNEGDEDDVEDILAMERTDADEMEDEELEDDESPKKKKKKKPTGKRNLSIIEVLAKKNLFLPTEKLIAKFTEQTKRYYQIAHLTGKQFTVNGRCYSKEEAENNRWRSRKTVPMEQDGVRNKIVIDTLGIPEGVVRTKETTYASTQLIPYHPYVRCYDLTKYRWVIPHVDLMEEYVYRPEIIHELILAKEEKQLFEVLISGENNFRDIISGKSGGLIILASGKPGTGKTLTAEVHSELVKKPLYQIQSAQLGLDVDTIEKNLQDVLRRAERWNAVLLIDECDTYVFRRGESMVQNAIVGTFLRLLEYFNGILFLTTNRSDIIDAAILSRVTAHVKFATPEQWMQKEIIKVIAGKHDIKVTDSEAQIIATNYPDMTGRDIRNMIKLVKKYYDKEGKQINLKASMIKPMEKFIPFL